jgi:pyrroline-5-carboxylate reductase
MGEALVKGLLSSRQFTPDGIIVSDRDPSRVEYIKERYGVIARANNWDLIKEVNPCILAVKPQDIDEVLEDIRDGFSEVCLLVSIVAGITIERIRSRMRRETKIIRVMPNAPALVGMAATGIYVGKSVSPEEGKVVQSIFDCVGKTVFVENEDHLNIVTGLSGSGPAYLFLILEALTDAGVYLGLSREVSAALSLQTIRGSAQMALEVGKPIPLLKEIITSPGGTTMAGLKVLEEGRLRATIVSAVEAATRRSRELAR